MGKSVHYVITSTAANLKQWPDGRDRCIFCGKSREDRDKDVDEFHTVFDPKKNWEAARKFRTMCREDDEIMAIWVMME